MKANELRIGNLVYWDIPQKKNVVHIISAILPNTLHTQPISLGKHKDYSPIPLTEEWLIKFGFKNLSIGLFELIYNNVIGYRLSIEGQNGYEEIKYVHQLQNLYFALIHKELELK